MKPDSECKLEARVEAHIVIGELSTSCPDHVDGSDSSHVLASAAKLDD